MRNANLEENLALLNMIQNSKGVHVIPIAPEGFIVVDGATKNFSMFKTQAEVDRYLKKNYK